MAAIVSVFVSNFHSHLFHVNFKPGQTDVAVALKGRNAKKLLSQLGPVGSKVLRVNAMSGSVSVKIIRLYKHLGDMMLEFAQCERNFLDCVVGISFLISF